jgi:hypothetical protein
MKYIFLLLSLCFTFNAQTVSVNGIATTPDVTTIVDNFLLTQTTNTTAPASAAIGSGDTTINLPTGIASACVENYASVTLSSASNVSTFGAATYNVPTGTQMTISNAATTAYNGTFATTSAPSTSSGFTIALTIANGTYNNPSPQTTGYINVAYNHCAVLVDSEALEITGYTGSTYTMARGNLGTAAASHLQGATMTLLKFTNMRNRYRWLAQNDQQTIVAGSPTTRVQSILSQINTLNAQLAALLGVAQ